jgi:tRNA pseudouridine38-40 synthase
MVRTIVGTLMQVGLGKINLKDFEMVIIGKDRKKAGHAAPPEGLFLSKVTYPYELRPIE